MKLRLRTDAGQTIVIGDGVIMPAATMPDVTVAVGTGTLRAGLINAHDHLHRNHYGRLGSPPYEDVYEWGRDIHVRHADEIARARAVPRDDALLFGALKNLLGGATTVVHHDAYEPAFERGFPVRVPRVQSAHSLGTQPDIAPDAARPFCIHLAEGVNRRAADEVDDLERRGLLASTLLAVHVVGVEESGIRALLASGAALVWCPTSNEFLFGRTAPRALFDSGIDVLLGSDSLLTGAGTLLDELRHARSHGYVSDARLVAAVGATAARRLGLPAPGLEPGAAADVILLRASLLEAGCADVALVMVGGVPLLADNELRELCELCGVETVTMQAGGRTKRIEPSLARVAQRVIASCPEAATIFA